MGLTRPIATCYLNGPGAQSRRPCHEAGARKVEILPPTGGTRVAGRVGRVTRVEDAMTGSAGGEVQVHTGDLDAHEDALTSVPNTTDAADMEADEDAQHTSTDAQHTIMDWMSCNAMIVMCCAAGMATGGPHDTKAVPVGGMQMSTPAHAVPTEDLSEESRLNRSEAIIVSYIVAQQISQSGATELLRIVRDPTFSPGQIRIGSWNQWVLRLSTLSAHGLHMVSLADPHHDGEQEVDFVFRSAWDVVQEFVRDPHNASLITWGFRPQVNAAGERVFGEITSGGWLEAAYASRNDPDITILIICMGSDATQIKKRRGRCVASDR